MREVVQSLRCGSVVRAEGIPGTVPVNGVCVRSVATVLSSGTERMLLEFGASGWLKKARLEPARVKDVGQKVRADGLVPTVAAVRGRLDEPIRLGYANAGVVIDVGRGVSGFRVGDVVASNGPHAEIVSVPATLCASVPDGVAPEEAAFASIASVALQGIRLVAPTLGERFVVTGLGLVGLIAVQLLRANGCEVLGIDVDPARLKLAESFGARTVLAGGNPVEAAMEFSRGRGVDGVVITAATKSSGPVHEAAQMCRKRGRIVLVGVTGLELQRSDFYEKELSFQVSCSYGPGRYDPAYEASNDYPLGFVRWTAGRNFEAVLDMLATGRLDVASLISHRFPFDRAQDAYTALTDDPTALGIVLQYPTEAERPTESLLERTVHLSSPAATTPGSTRVGLVGAGQFATNIVLPALQQCGARLVAVASSGGSSASSAARRFSIERATNDTAAVIDAADIDTVFVLTRHDSHADLAVQALDAGKHVFVEKPLAISAAGLERVIDAWERRSAEEKGPLVGIGFNRRFSPITKRMVELLDTMSVPRAITITVNAGAIPASHWTQDPGVGGGRIIGEACHFVDLARYLAGSRIDDVQAMYLERQGPADSAVITLRHENGSVSTINYFANGSKRFPKEQVAVFAGGRVLVNDNFRKLTGYGWPRFRSLRLRKQDKGHAAGIAAFLDATRSGAAAPIPFEEIVEVTAATLAAADKA